MKKIVLGAVLSVASLAFGQESLTAVMKAEYEYHYVTNRVDDGTDVYNVGKYVLQIAPEASRWYDPRTIYVDSLTNDPNGKKIYNDMLAVEFERQLSTTGMLDARTLRDKVITRGSRHSNMKDFAGGIITVYDSKAFENHTYTVAMSDMEWVIGDSVKTVLGYECQQAFSDYHGRRWEVWFAPDVAVSDGPWQFCGLPGLIMEARCEGGEYAFVITGLVRVSEPLKPVYNIEKYNVTDRESFLRLSEDVRNNPEKYVGAYTGMPVTTVSGSKSYKQHHKPIECDVK